jgi:hypothetical protein
MNSIIISEILAYYNKTPYYIMNNYICINDDRFGRIVSFKLYISDGNIFVDFKESNRAMPLYSTKYITKIIHSFQDFKEKWINYYNSSN